MENEVKQINAGKYNRKIKVYKITKGKDAAGFPTETKEIVLKPYASVKTTKGYTLITSNTDFEKALTNFTIRYPHSVEITRDMFIEFNKKPYTIEYLNNINGACVELEIQAKEVLH